jgi:hypothetical protein
MKLLKSIILITISDDENHNLNDEEFDQRKTTRIKTNSNDRCTKDIYLDNYLSKELNPKNSSFDRVKSGGHNSDKGKTF